MKKIIFKLVVLSLIITGCSSSSSNDNSNSTNNCGNISSFTVTQQNEKIAFNLVSTATPLFYEVSVVNSSNSSSGPDFGSINPINSTTQVFDISNLGINPGGTYLFYIRTVCSDGSKSNWSAPKSLAVTSYCHSPYDLGFSGYFEGMGFHWTIDDTNTSYYQVQYGLQGFTLGSGTSVNVNDTHYTGMPMAANSIYDFYVRSYCTSALGWSSWSGPYTYHATANQNLCTLPLNLSYQTESILSQTAWVSLHWNSNGETNFEYVVVNHGASVTTGTVNSADNTGWPTINLSRFTTYDFYMRTVCANGNRTAWTTAKLISL
jgi:hypothetical protein